MKKYIFLFLLMSCSLVAKNLPVSTPAPKKDLRWDVTGSFTYWQPYQDSMNLGLFLPNLSFNSYGDLSDAHASLIRFKPNYVPGLKVGAGYLLKNDKWSLHADYTFFRANNQASRTIHLSSLSPQPSELVTVDLLSEITFNNPLSFNVATSIHAKWHLQVDNLNFVLKRSCPISTSFKVTPFIGGAAVILDQKLRQKIELINPSSPSAAPPFLYTRANVNTSSWSLGPRFGVESQWSFCDCFHLNANLAADLLYTRYHLKTNQYTTNNSTIYFHSTNHLNAFRAELDAYVGLAWNKDIGKKYALELAAGYDFQLWWNQNMMWWYVLNVISASQGNLYLQGLTVSAKLSF